MSSQVVCVDFGSTFTKAALVDVDAGELLATASSQTTIDSDVMDGYDVCRAALSVSPSVPSVACSSAGGGLRLAVVGYERVITAEAGSAADSTSSAALGEPGSSSTMPASASTARQMTHTPPLLRILTRPEWGVD